MENIFNGHGFFVSDDMNIKKTVVLCSMGYNSYKFVDMALLSLFAKTCTNDYTLILWDNGMGLPYNLFPYTHYGMAMNCYIVNNFGIQDFDGKIYRQMFNYDWVNDSADYVYSNVIDICIESLKPFNVENLIIMDSDVIIKKNIIDVIDENFITACDLQNPKGFSAFMYLNLKMMNELEIKFYDPNRIYKDINAPYNGYIVGTSFIEDIKKSGNEKKIKIFDQCEYAAHFGRGCWQHSENKIKEIYNFYKENL